MRLNSCRGQDGGGSSTAAEAIGQWRIDNGPKGIKGGKSNRTGALLPERQRDACACMQHRPEASLLTRLTRPDKRRWEKRGWEKRGWEWREVGWRGGCDKGESRRARGRGRGRGGGGDCGELTTQYNESSRNAEDVSSKGFQVLRAAERPGRRLRRDTHAAYSKYVGFVRRVRQCCLTIRIVL